MGNQEWLLQSLIKIYYDEALSATFALNDFRGFLLTVASSLALFIIYDAYSISRVANNYLFSFYLLAK